MSFIPPGTVPSVFHIRLEIAARIGEFGFAAIHFRRWPGAILWLGSSTDDMDFFGYMNHVPVISTIDADQSITDGVEAVDIRVLAGTQAVDPAATLVEFSFTGRPPTPTYVPRYGWFLLANNAANVARRVSVIGEQYLPIQPVVS